MILMKTSLTFTFLKIRPGNQNGSGFQNRAPFTIMATYLILRNITSY